MTTTRKRMSVRSLRRGMRIMAICGDADDPDCDQIPCPLLVVRVDRSDEDLTSIELCNERTKMALGTGTFDNQAVAWIANKDDLLLLAGSPSSPPEDAGPLGVAASLPGNNGSAVMAVAARAPEGWPHFPKGVGL